jgi:prepilin peptidase CpaA
MISFAAIATAASLAFTAGALGWAAISDVRRYVIPNSVSVIVALAFGLTACFLPTKACHDFLFGGLLTSLAVFLSGVAFFARGWMGGGDVKLLTAMALWAGPAYLSPFALVTTLAGALVAIAMLSPLRRYLPPPTKEALELTAPLGAPPRQPMPFGVAIAVGGAYVLIQHLPLLR